MFLRDFLLENVGASKYLSVGFEITLRLLLTLKLGSSLRDSLLGADSMADSIDSSGSFSGSTNIEDLIAICVNEDVNVPRDCGKLKC